MLLLMSLRRYNSVFEVSNCLLIVSRSEECCEMSRSKRVFEVLFSESSQALKNFSMTKMHLHLTPINMTLKTIMITMNFESNLSLRPKLEENQH